MIQIDIPFPKSCANCKLKQIDLDMSGEFYYWCPLCNTAIRGKKYEERRFRKCPLKEVKECAGCEYYVEDKYSYCRRSEVIKE